MSCRSGECRMEDARVVRSICSTKPLYIPSKRVAAMAKSFAEAFPNGISSGDVTQTSAVLWTRAVETGPVTFQIASDSSFDHVIKTKKVAAPHSDIPVKIEFDHLKLEPDQDYFYRAIDKSGDVIEGRFDTPAKLGTHEGFHFGVIGDWMGELAPFVSIKYAASADLDLVIKFGDTVYADLPPPVVTTLPEFRLAHDEVYSSDLGFNF